MKIKLHQKLLFVCLAWLPMAHAEKVYVTMDENGVPIFSDEKTAGSETVEIRETMTFSNPVNAPKQRPTVKLSPEDGPIPNYQLAITDPENGAAIRENAGNLTLTVALSPGVKSNHRAELVMDGKVVKTVTSGGPVMLTNVDRGTHQFALRVVDSSGNEIASSPVVSVSMLRFFRKRAN